MSVHAGAVVVLVVVILAKLVVIVDTVVIDDTEDVDVVATFAELDAVDVSLVREVGADISDDVVG